MARGEVLDVDVVALRGAVLGRVVVTVDREEVAPPDGDLAELVRKLERLQSQVETLSAAVVSAGSALSRAAGERSSAWSRRPTT